MDLSEQNNMVHQECGGAIVQTALSASIIVVAFKINI